MDPQNSDNEEIVHRGGSAWLDPNFLRGRRWASYSLYSTPTHHHIYRPIIYCLKE